MVSAMESGSGGTVSRAIELANGVYGTIVAAGVLAATASDDKPDAGQTAFYLGGTVIVLWVAHAWSDALGHRAAGADARERRFRHWLVADRALALSALPPLFALLVAALGGASDQTAITVALYVCVVTLAVGGGVIARNEGASPGRVLLTALGTGSLGLLLVALKAVVH
jgi:hypothetical protein